MSETKKAKKPHLGKGLEALLGPINFSVDSGNIPAEGSKRFPPDEKMAHSLTNLDLSQIRPNPYQPRTHWDDSNLAELSESIKVNGILQPVIVRPGADGGFELIAGERRMRAAEMAGLKSIPVLIRNASDEQMLELALIENIHREDLNPVERARAYQRYLQSFNMNQTQAAQRLGEDRSVISNFIRLLDLPKEIQQMLIDKQLSMGHARAILALPDEDIRKKLANRALAGRLSVREVERIVRKLLNREKQTDQQKRQKEAYIVDLETQLQSILGTKVRIEPYKKGSRGRIIIDYYSLDEFERLTDKMGLGVNEPL